MRAGPSEPRARSDDRDCSGRLSARRGAVFGICARSTITRPRLTGRLEQLLIHSSGAPPLRTWRRSRRREGRRTRRRRRRPNPAGDRGMSWARQRAFISSQARPQLLPHEALPGSRGAGGDSGRSVAKPRRSADDTIREPSSLRSVPGSRPFKGDAPRGGERRSFRPSRFLRARRARGVIHAAGDRKPAPLVCA